MGGFVEPIRFIIVVGVLVFVHELGHFLMAKRSGVLVQRFSFGFGPRLFGVRKGETDYCVSAIPFGGYVKMAGQEDVPGTDDAAGVPEERKFSSKTVSQRMKIIVAGPLMNLVLGFVIFIVLMVVGQEVPRWWFDTRIGAVEPGSPAEEAGLRPNDKVTSINGKPVTKWQDLVIASLTNAEREMTLGIERDGETMSFRVRSTDFDDSGQPRLGIEPFERAIIGTPSEGMPAADAGLQKGDVIVAVNGAPVGKAKMSRITSESIGEPLEYEVERDGARFKRTITPTAVGTIEHMDVVNGRVEIIQRDFAKETKILPGDEIRSIDGVPVEPDQVQQIIMENPGSTLTLGIHRPPRKLFRLIPLRGSKDFSVDIAVQQRGVIGVPLAGPDVPQPTILVRYNLIQAIPRGIAEGWGTFVTSAYTLKLILTRRISTKALGGPVAIYRMTQEVAREGIDWLMKFVGLISIYLSIFNLLPIPVLDGGHVLFLAIEGVRRKPVDMKYQEMLQYVGVALVLIFFLYITYNDIMRIVGEQFLR
jgi:regulator of sigma E protease